MTARPLVYAMIEPACRKRLISVGTALSASERLFGDDCEVPGERSAAAELEKGPEFPCAKMAVVLKSEFAGALKFGSVVPEDQV